MFCKNCGNIMNDNDKFCKSCGAPAPKDQQPQQNSYGYQQNNYGYQQPQQNGYGYQQNNYQGYQQGYQPRQAKPGVTFADAIRLYFSNFTNFSGRARRSEYWYASLFVFLVNMVVAAVIPDLAGVISLVFFLPSLAVAIRRLHDVGKSGWFYLWILLPLAGSIILLIQFCKDSEPGDNQFGPSTKY